MADQKADTFGWDTVFAIRVDDVNTSIVRAKSSPTSFSATGTDTLSGTQFSLSGTFADWQITLGGSGILIHMAAPVPTMNVKSANAEFQFSNGEFVIEVRLDYLPHTKTPVNSTGTFHNLVIKQKTAEDDNVVRVISSRFAEANYDDFRIDIHQAITEWFDEHLSDFVHVFATVNLNRVADKGQFEWILPTTTSYAYIDGETVDDSVLGILCMTQGRSSEGLLPEVSPNAIPEGSRAGFLISPERFLFELVLPTMPIVFPGSDPNAFGIGPDNRSIVLKDDEPLELIVEHEGNSYTTFLQRVEISTLPGQITMDVQSMVEPSWEIYSHVHNLNAYDITLHTVTTGANAGQQTLFYVTPPPPYTPVMEHFVTEGEGAEIVAGLEKIIAALITIVVGIVTDGAGFVAAALILGVLAGVAGEIPNIIASANTDDAPPIGMLRFNCIDPIRWADQTDFTLDQAAMNLSLQLGGTPHFSEFHTATQAASGWLPAPVILKESM